MHEGTKRARNTSLDGFQYHNCTNCSFDPEMVKSGVCVTVCGISCGTNVFFVCAC